MGIRTLVNICCTKLGVFLLLHSILIFPLLLVIMKPLIFVYCYYNEGYNVLDIMEFFPHVDLIIIRKIYDFYHVVIFINLSDVTTEGLSYSLLDNFPHVLVITGPLLY